jgi:hypothetical protein
VLLVLALVLAAEEVVHALAPAHSTRPERLWTAFAVVFVGVNGPLWGLVVWDLFRIHRDRVNGIVRRAARGNLRRQSKDLFFQLTMLGVGLVFVHEPPSNPAQPISLLAIVLMVAFIAMEVLTGLSSVRDWVDRRWIDRYVEPDPADTARKAREVAEEVAELATKKTVREDT